MVDLPPMLLARERALVWWGVALPCLLLMVCLLAPTVTRGGDCGELIAASYRLGIAHPSGYPVWCLIGRIFALLPIGEIAWRYNFFSAVCGAGATGTIALCVHRLVWASLRRGKTEDDEDDRVGRATARWSGWGAGWLLTGFFYVSTQFLLAEVYALAALMGALLLYFAIAWHQNNDWRDAATLALLAGLVPVVHLSGLFFLPFLFFLAVWKRGLGARRLATAGAFFVCGLLPALYLPIRSAPFPAPPPTSIESSFYWPLDWSHPASARGFRQHITAAQYRTLLVETTTATVGGQTVTRRQMAQPIRAIPARLRELGTFVLLQYLWATPLLLVGAIAAWRDKRVGWVLLLIWLSNIATQINYKVGDQSNFFFPAYLVMAVWMGLGLSVFLGALLRRGGLAGAAAPLLLLATVAVQWSIFAPAASQRGVTRTRDGALEQARSAQEAATRARRPATILFRSDDALWGFWYAKYALEAAPDVATPWGRLVSQRALKSDASRYVAQLKPKGPVFLNEWDEATNARFPLVIATPSGNLVQASDRKLPPPAKPIEAASGPATPGPNGLQSARFRRAELWKQGAPKGGTLNLAITSLAAFEVEFRAPTPIKTRIAPRWGDHKAGQIEVLIAPQNSFAKGGPAPDQKPITPDNFNADRVLISRQKRDLILPGDFRAGALYRASVPLMLESESVVGRYQVWTRLPKGAADQTTPWTLTDEVFLTHS